MFQLCCLVVSRVFGVLPGIMIVVSCFGILQGFCSHRGGAISGRPRRKLSLECALLKNKQISLFCIVSKSRSTGALSCPVCAAQLSVEAGMCCSQQPTAVPVAL